MFAPERLRPAQRLAPTEKAAGSPDYNEPSSLLTQRSALILLLAVAAALTVSALLLLGGYTPALAALGGLGTLAGAVKLFHWLIT
ncbi:MAG TPA: hypothetical protein VE673_17520 [Pseudonocardiaceae bacterium]|nr:hypothetical protein [Pseudonocardiaceae bacterium]